MEENEMGIMNPRGFIHMTGYTTTPLGETPLFSDRASVIREQRFGNPESVPHGVCREGACSVDAPLRHAYL